MPDDIEHLHRDWYSRATDEDGRDFPLRVSFERLGTRGIAAYAYVESDEGRDRDQVLTSVEYAENGPEAFRMLRAKLESERGMGLADEETPNWLMAPEWMQTHRKPQEEKQGGAPRKRK